MLPSSLLQFHKLIWCLLLTTLHTSSPCNFFWHTTCVVFKEFLEKGGDFNQKLSQIPQLAHTHCLKSPAIDSRRSQPHVYKLNLGPLSKKSTHAIGIISSLSVISVHRKLSLWVLRLKFYFLTEGQRLNTVLSQHIKKPHKTIGK